jgi:hypothetical protein
MASAIFSSSVRQGGGFCRKGLIQEGRVSLIAVGPRDKAVSIPAIINQDYLKNTNKFPVEGAQQ